MTGTPWLAAARRQFAIDVGVDPRPDVLEIDDQDVDPLEHFSRRFSGVAVQRIHWHASSRVGVIRRFDHVVLYVGPEAMLWAEDGRHVHVGGFRKSIDYVLEGVINRRVIADDANACAPEARRFEQDV